MNSNVKKYNCNSECPVCSGGYHFFSYALRSIEVLVKIHPESQFPITITTPEGHAIAELPLCPNTVAFFKYIPKEGKKVTIYCQD